MNNENKILSQNRKRRLGRQNKLNDDIKLLLKKIKSEKKKNKNFDRIKELEILLVRIQYNQYSSF